MRSLRSTVLTLLAAVAAMLVIGWVVGWATKAHWSSMDPRERAHFNPIDPNLVGVNLAQLAIGVLGVLLISGEYATGMIRATLAAVPHRLPVLWAKTALFAVTTFATMFVSSLAAFLLGQHFLGAHGTTLSAPRAWRAILGVTAYLTVVGGLAVALGFLLRSTAGGIATLAALLLVLPGIGQVLPASWQQHTLPYLPTQRWVGHVRRFPGPWLPVTRGRPGHAAGVGGAGVGRRGDPQTTRRLAPGSLVTVTLSLPSGPVVQLLGISWLDPRVPIGVEFLRRRSSRADEYDGG